MLKDDGSYEHIAWVPTKEESGKGDLIGLDPIKRTTFTSRTRLIRNMTRRMR
jgi:hypothetical protein